MLKCVINGLIRVFGRKFLEEWLPVDHVCVTSTSNPEIHLADFSIPESVFRNFSSPFSLVSSHISRVVVRCDWSTFFSNNRRGRIKIDVEGVNLVVRAKSLDEFDPDLCAKLALKKKRRYLAKWLKFSGLGINADKTAKFVNCLSIRAKNVKITFVDDVIYKNPFSIVIKADLVTGGGVESKNPILTDLERKSFAKNLLTCLLFKSKNLQIYYNSYETGHCNTESQAQSESEASVEFDSESHFSDDLFVSDWSDQEEAERRDLSDFLNVKTSDFCTFCSNSPKRWRRIEVKESEKKYLEILNMPHKRFKLTTRDGIYVGISVKIWNLNSAFFVDKIACEPLQKIKLFLCGNDGKLINQPNYASLFDGSVRYPELKLNFCSEFVHTLHDFIRFVRFLSAFKQASTGSFSKIPSVKDAVRYCNLLKRTKLFNLSSGDEEFMESFERETSLGVLVRLHSYVNKFRNRKRQVFSEHKSDSQFPDNIRIENVFDQSLEFEKNFANFQADQYASNSFNSNYYFTNTLYMDLEKSSNRDDWFLGTMSFGIIAPNLRVDLIPVSNLFSSDLKNKAFLYCIIAQVSCFYFNIVQMSEKRSSIKIVLSKPLCRYGKVESYVKRYSFSCDFIPGQVVNEKIVAGPTLLLDKKSEFFRNFGSDNVNNFPMDDISEVKKQGLITVLIESYLNCVKKNLINMGDFFLLANSFLELYSSVEANLLNRVLNQLLTFELFLHRTFTASNRLYSNPSYPLTDKTNYVSQDNEKIDEFVNRFVDERLSWVTTNVRRVLSMRNRSLVKFTSCEMRMLCFFGNYSSNKVRLDAKEMYEVNREALNSWGFRKSVDYFYGKSNEQGKGDEKEDESNVVVTVLDGDDFVDESVSCNWYRNVKRGLLDVDSLLYLSNKCLQVNLEKMQVFVDSFTTSRKIMMNRVEVNTCNGEETDKVKLLSVDFFSIHLVKDSSVFLVDLKGVELFSQLIELFPLVQNVEHLVKFSEDVRNMVEFVKNSTCHTPSQAYYAVKPDFTDADFFNFDPEKIKKIMDLESNAFNLIACYSCPIYELQVVKFKNDWDTKLLLFLQEFKLMLNHYLLSIAKLDVEFLQGNKKKVKVGLKGSKLVHSSAFVKYDLNGNARAKEDYCEVLMGFGLSDNGDCLKDEMFFQFEENKDKLDVKLELKNFTLKYDQLFFQTVLNLYLHIHHDYLVKFGHCLTFAKDGVVDVDKDLQLNKAKLHLSCCNALLFVENFGVVLDIFCLFEKNFGQLNLNLTRLSIGLLWANFTRFLTFSLVDLTASVDDYNVFTNNCSQDADGKNDISVKLLQFAAWYHVHNYNTTLQNKSGEISDVLNSLTLLFNENWFSHLTWCVMPNCYENDLVVPIFFTKISSYSRLKPVLNKSYIRHYVTEYSRENGLKVDESGLDGFISEYLSKIDVVEKEDCYQISCDVSSTRFNSSVINTGRLKFGEFFLKLNLDLLKDLKEYINGVSNTLSNIVQFYHHTIHTIQPSCNNTNSTNLGKSSSNTVKDTVKDSGDLSLIFDVEISVNGNLGWLSTDYSFNVPCSYLPSENGGFEDFNLRLLQLYPQHKLVVNFAYNFNLLMQYNMDEDMLYKMNKKWEDDPDKREFLSLLSEQYYTFDGNLIFSLSKCDLFLDLFTNHPSNFNSSVPVIKRFRSIELVDPVEQFELIKIINLSLYDKRVNFVKNEDRVLLQVFVDKLQVLDYFGKNLIDSVYETRLKASQIYDFGDEFKSKQKCQIMLNFSKSEASQLNVVVENTLTEIQPDFIDLILLILSHFKFDQNKSCEFGESGAKEFKSDLKMSLSLNMYEVWLYPSMEFYTKDREINKIESVKNERVMHKILKDNQPGDKESSDFPNVYNDGMHILCLLLTVTVSNNKGYQKASVKYCSATLGSVLLLENNFKVLVDQNGSHITSKVNDPCNRFLFEIKSLNVKFKNGDLQLQVDKVKLYNSINDFIRLYYLKDYFYTSNLKLKTSHKPDPVEPVENMDSLDTIDGVIQFLCANDSVNSSTEKVKEIEKKVNKLFNMLNKLHNCLRSFELSCSINEFQAIMSTGPNSLILGLLVHNVNFNFSKLSDSNPLFSLSFLFDLSLLNNKFVPNDYLLQTTPFKLEISANESNPQADRNILVINLQLGTVTFDFSNNTCRLIKYLLNAIKKIKEVEKSIEVGRITVYNELEYDICVFSGNVKREMDYLLVPNNSSVKLFSREFTLLISNKNNAFSKCDNLLGYLDNNLLFGNTNNVTDFINLHNYSNTGSREVVSKGKRHKLGRLEAVSKVESQDSLRDNFIYLGRFEGNESILKLPNIGEMILIEQVNSKVIVTTNIKIENLTDVTLTIKCSDQSCERGANRINLNSEPRQSVDLVVENFTSVGVPISWYNTKFVPTISYNGLDSVSFEALKTLLNNQTGGDFSAFEEYVLKFKSGLCFKSCCKTVIVNDLDEVDCVKYCVTIEPMFRIQNKLPFSLTVYFSSVKSNSKVKYKGEVFDRADTLSLVQNEGGTRELEPNETWGISLYSFKFYLKLSLRGIPLLNPELSPQGIVYVSDLFEVNLPNSGNLVTSKSLAYKSGPIFETAFRHFEPLLSQSEFEKNKQAFYQLVKKAQVSISLCRDAVSVFWSLIFENFTRNFLALNGNLIPPGFKLFATSKELNNAKLRAYTRANHRFLPTKQVEKLDFGSTTANRAPIQLFSESGAECAVIGCTVRSLEVSSFPTRVVVFHSYYTVINRLCYDVIFRCKSVEVKVFSNSSQSVNTLCTEASLTILDGEEPSLVDFVDLNPSKIPLKLQIKPKTKDKAYILNVDIVEGKFENGLPCKFNGLYFILSVANTANFQLLNLTSSTLYVVDPNYIQHNPVTLDTKSTNSTAQYDNKMEDNLVVLEPFKPTWHVLCKSDDRRLSFRANLDSEWSVYDIDTLKNIKSFVVENRSLYLTCIMKRDGTRVICFLDDYILLCKVLQRVEMSLSTKIESFWSKIALVFNTPRITITMSSKRKLVLACHVNNLFFNTTLSNSNSQVNNKYSEDYSKYSISCSNDWVIDLEVNIKGCHIDHFVQGFIPVILKAITNRHSVQSSFLTLKVTCTIFSKTIQTFDKVYVKMSPLSLNVEMRVIEQIADYLEIITSESQSLKNSASLAEMVRKYCPLPNVMDRKKRLKKYFKSFTIEPIVVFLAIRTSDVKLSRQGLQLLDALPLDTPSVCVQFFRESIVQTVSTFDELAILLRNSYFKQLIRQSLPSAWLSNSLAVVYGVVKGFVYLFSQPFSCCKKFKNSFEGFLIGINNGIKYFVLFIVGGFAQSIGHLLNIVYKIMGRSRAKPVGLLDGFWIGINSLILDVVYNPWKKLFTEFNKEFGIKRFLKNAVNVTKCAISPVTGVINLMVSIVEGLSNVLLGDFEQFTHLYETDQLNMNLT